MTSVNVTENKYSVSVTEGATTVVTVKAPGPQGVQGATGATGAGISAGDKGALTVAANLTDWTLNDSVVTNAKVSASAAIAGTKISPDFGSQNITTTGNAVFGGDLTVSGTTTTIDSTTLTVEDKNIELGKVGSPTDITADGGGITLLGDTNHTFNWLNATDSWTSSEHIALPDNKKLKLGADNDVEIYSNGSHGFVQNAQGGQLHLNANSVLIKNAANSESYIRAFNNGAVELYYDNVKKAETTADGLNISSNTSKVGTSLFSNASFNNYSYQYGANGVERSGLTIKANEPMLEIIAQSSGTHAGSILIRDAGHDGFGFVNDPTDNELQLKSFTSSDNNFRINGTGHNVSRLDNCIVIKKDGSVSLFHDGTKKAETVSTGLDVDGNVIANNLIVANGISHEGQTNTNIAFDGTSIKFQSNGVERFSVTQFAAFITAGYKLAFVASSGENPTLRSGGTNNGDLLIESGTASMAQFKRNGAVELYHNGTKKAETNSNGMEVTGDLDVTGAIKHVGDTNTLIHFSAEDVIEFKTFGFTRLNINNFNVSVNRLLKATEGIEVTGNVEPEADNTRALGSSSKRFSTLHVNSVKASTGILFGSDTADANTLDDYEEGTFTPTLEGTSSNPTVNYHFRSGHYTKIGNVVYVQIVVIHDSHTGGSGEWQCGGLPFTSSSTATSSYNFNWNQNNRVAWGTSTKSLGIYVSTGTSRVRARQFGDNLNAPLQLSAFNNSQRTVFGIHGSYIAA